MAYRIPVKFKAAELEAIASIQRKASRIATPILEEVLTRAQHWYGQNLSGKSFTSRTGTHVIQKRTGKGFASIQTEIPYGQPNRGRLFADAQTRYANNPEFYNYLRILETGRGEVRPRYTRSVMSGNPERARLIIPARGGTGGHLLTEGVNGFRGKTGRYHFVKKLPPMEGKYPLEAAVEQTKKEISGITHTHVQRLLNNE